MSGPLVGLVRDHGPTDHNAWAVLTVIAEDLRGPLRTATLDNAELCRSSRLSRMSVKRAVAALVADGWVSRTPGRHKGVSSTYALRLDRFPSEAVNALLERGSHRTPLEDSASSTGDHTGPLSRPKGTTQSAKGTTQDPPSVSVPAPVRDAGGREGSPDDPLPVLVSARTGPDDDTLRTALDTFAVRHPSRILRAEVGAALGRGWTASGINRALRAEVPDVRRCGDVAAVLVAAVRSLGPAEPPRVAPTPAPEPAEETADAETVAATVAETRRALAATRAGVAPASPAAGGHRKGATKNGTRKERGTVKADWLETFKAKTS